MKYFFAILGAIPWAIIFRSLPNETTHMLVLFQWINLVGSTILFSIERKKK